MSNNDILFFKVWRNIVIKKLILNETKLYKDHSKCRTYSNTKELCQYKYIGYVTQVFLSDSKPFINGFEIPLNIVSLHFHKNLNQCLLVGNIPNSIKRLSFQRLQKRNILSDGCIPNSVTELNIGDHLFVDIKLPNSICKLKMNSTNFINYYQECKIPTGPELIPSGVKSITFGYRFDSIIIPGSLENGIIETLKFGCCFDQILKPNSIPTTIKYLWFGKNYNCQIDQGILPNKIETLRFGKKYNRTLGIGCIPSSVTTLYFGNTQCQPVTIPLSVTTLMIGDGLLDQINSIPNSVESLIFCNDFSKHLDLSIIPSTIKSISINSNYIYLASLLVSNINNNFKINLIN